MRKTAPKVILLSAIILLFLSACTPNSGIFAGGNWQSSGLPHQHIRALAVDFNNPQVIYAASSQGKNFTSNDGGQHWIERSSGLPTDSSINVLSFDTTGKKLYAATGAGLFVSTDAALHWNKVAAGGPFNFTSLAFNFREPHTMYAGTAFQGVLRSSDDGNTWSSANTGLPPGITINTLTFDSENQQLWAATSSGVYRSDDRGFGWQAFNTGLPTSIVVYSVQPDTIVPGGTRGLIFAGTNHGFFFSQDAGAHWTSSQDSLVGTNVRVIYVDFHKPTTLFVGTDVGVLRSDNSGQNWGGVGSGMPRDQSVHAIMWGTSGYTQLFAAADDVYMYPGTGGGFSFNRLIELLIVAVFFYALYRLARRRRRTSKTDRNAEHSKVEERSDLAKTSNLT
jgi:ligand-binding sensor domain-containing protein